MRRSADSDGRDLENLEPIPNRIQDRHRTTFGIPHGTGVQEADRSDPFIPRPVGVTVEKIVGRFGDQSIDFSLEVTMGCRDPSPRDHQPHAGMIDRQLEDRGVVADARRIDIAQHQAHRTSDQAVHDGFGSNITQVEEELRAGILENPQAKLGSLGRTVGIGDHTEHHFGQGHPFSDRIDGICWRHPTIVACPRPRVEPRGRTTRVS